MATKIITKNSSTTTAIPTAADLVQGELAVNVTDKRLFTENSAGAIVEVGTNPSTLTVTGEITANGGIALGDNDKATFGAGDDLQIYHDGSNNRLDSVSSSLVVKAPQFVVQDAEGTKNMIWVPQGGSGYEVQLSHDGTTKLTTTATGIDVTGAVNSDTLDVTGSTGIIARFRDSTNGIIDIKTTGTTNADPMQINGSNRNIELAVNGLAKLATTATGIDVTGAATFSDTVWLLDGKNIYLGTDGDMRVRHDNSNGYIDCVTGSLILRTGGGATEKMTLNASGNLGLGVTPSAWNSSTPALQILNASIYGYGNYECGVQANLYYDGAGWKHISTAAATQYQQASGKHTWLSGSSASAGAAATMATNMTLDASGKLSINTTSATAAYLKAAGVYGASYAASFLTNSANSSAVVVFENTNGIVGNIGTSGSSTSYNTSSDYRLKEDDVPMTGATERVKALRPINFAWKVDGSRTDGFFAHEAQEVVPECSTGTKDAMRDEEYEVTPAVEEVRDEDDNIITEAVAAVMGTRSVPDYQGIDQSKLVPLLTATIQELIARIEALEGA